MRIRRLFIGIVLFAACMFMPLIVGAEEIKYKLPLDEFYVTDTIYRNKKTLLWEDTNNRFVANYSHGGLDLRANYVNVYAVTSGIITFSGTESGSGGQGIVLTGDDGLIYEYAHLSNRKVTKGTHVNAGDVIAVSGATGNVTGPHLHFQIGLTDRFDETSLSSAYNTKVYLKDEGVTKTLRESYGWFGGQKQYKMLDPETFFYLKGMIPATCWLRVSNGSCYGDKPSFALSTSVTSITDSSVTLGYHCGIYFADVKKISRISLWIDDTEVWYEIPNISVDKNTFSYPIGIGQDSITVNCSKGTVHSYYFSLTYNGVTYRSDAGHEGKDHFMVGNSTRPQYATFTLSKDAPFRTGHDSDATTICMVSSGTNVTIYGATKNHTGNKWYYVKYNNQYGWIYAGNGKYNAWDSVVSSVNSRLRKAPVHYEPSGNSGYVTELKNKSKVTVVDEFNNGYGNVWYLVERRGAQDSFFGMWDDGWLWSEYLMTGTMQIIDGEVLYITSDSEIDNNISSPSVDFQPVVIPQDNCSCSSSYSGYYVVTGTDGTLAINNIHGYNASSAIGSIPEGTIIYITKATGYNGQGKSSGKWGHVSYNGVTGYCSMNFLKKVDSPNGYIPEENCLCSTIYAGEYIVSGTDGILAINNFHGYNSSSKVGEIPEGTRIVISKATGYSGYGNSSGNWGHVTYNGVSGYCAMNYLKKVESVSGDTCSEIYAGDYMVYGTDGFLGINSFHGYNNSSMIGSIPEGSVVRITKATGYNGQGNSSGNWGHVTYNGVSGYCAMNYLVKIETTIEIPQITLNKSSFSLGESVVINWVKTNDASVLEGYWINIKGPNGDYKVNEWVPNGSATYTYTIPTNVDVGEYVVTMTAVPKDTNKYSNKVSTHLFNVYDPIINPVITLERQKFYLGESVLINWAKSSLSEVFDGEYWIRIVDSNNNVKVNEGITKGNGTYTYVIPSNGATGTYSLSISALTKNKEVYGEKVYTTSFNVLEAMVVPRISINATTYGTGESVNISWVKSPEDIVEGYLIEIINDNADVKFEQMVSNSDNSFIYNIPFDEVEGDYKVRITTISHNSDLFENLSYESSFAIIKSETAFIDGAALSVFDTGELALKIRVAVNDKYGSNPIVSISIGDSYIQGIISEIGKKIDMVANKSYDWRTGYSYYEIVVPCSAKQMTENICVKLYSDNEFTAESDFDIATYLVKCYENGSASKELVNSLLNYGAAAQKYFGYNTDNLANKSLSSNEKVVTSLALDDFVCDEYTAKTILPDGLNYIGVSLVIGSKLSVKNYFELEEGKKVNDYLFSEGNGNKCKLVTESGRNIFSVECYDLTLSSITEAMTININNGKNKYSVPSGTGYYIYLVLESNAGSKELIELLSAMNQVGTQMKL